MGLPEAASLACLYFAQRLLRFVHDAALCLLPQYAGSRKLHVSRNILAEKKCVTPSCFRQWDRKQRYARLFQIPGKRSAVKVEFLGEDRCCYVLSRELPDFVR